MKEIRPWSSLYFRHFFIEIGFSFFSAALCIMTEIPEKESENEINASATLEEKIHKSEI